MRDIKRIKPFCDTLAEAWSEVPDWRFGQFASNFLGFVYEKTKIDPFFLEDDELEKLLKDFVKKGV